MGYGVETAGGGFLNTLGFVFRSVRLLGTAWGLFSTGVSSLMNWGVQMTGVVSASSFVTNTGVIDVVGDVVVMGSVWEPTESNKTMLHISSSWWACINMQRPIPCPSILSASSLSRYPTLFPSLNACTKICMRFQPS